MRRRAIAALLVVAAAGCGRQPAGPSNGPAAQSAPAPDPAQLAAVEAWRAGRLERLMRPDGWLSLAGLYWLAEGESSFGSDRENDLVFPAGKAAARLGVLRREGLRVWLEAAPDAAITSGGEPVTRRELVTDAAGEPTVLEHRSLSFYVLVRGERVGLRLKDAESPLLRDFPGLDHYPVDPAWRVEARYERYPEPRTVAVPNIIGDAFDTPVYGSLVFDAAGRELRLEPLGEPDQPLFLVFGDETNGRETYGGGRFLYADPPDAAGRTVLEFNQAYNPPCVFTPYATCPLPPPGNRLPLAVRAGEKSFGAGH